MWNKRNFPKSHLPETFKSTTTTNQTKHPHIKVVHLKTDMNQATVQTNRSPQKMYKFKHPGFV